MSLGPRLDLRQSQSLVMTPQLQQAIKLLALSNLELEAAVAEEVEKNPLLVTGEEGSAPPRPEAAPPAEADALVAGEGRNEAALDVDFATETFHHDSFADAGVGGGGGASAEGIDFDSFAAPEVSLHDHLLAQAGQALDGMQLVIAAHLIDRIDECGYLRADLLEVAQRLGAPLAKIDAALAALQSFDPAGVGARDLAECLAIQAREADRYDPCMARLIAHLDLVARGDFARLKRLCEVDDEDLADMLRELRGYDPKPGCRFGGERAASVVPDLFITRNAKGWSVELNPATLPRVLVDKRYHAELAAGARDKAAKGWLGEQLAGANWLVKALDQRQRTILKVASEIVTQQEGFFQRGVQALRPLTLAKVAEAIGMHESTVSRVTSNKYLECARGLFELKYFFTTAIQSADGGEAASAEAVRAAIRTLIAGEDAKAVLSDDTLVDLLKAQGFDIARRTVAKYREGMGLGSSVQRRRQKALESRAA